MANATWDPTTVTAVTLSGGNLVATNTGTTSADQGARAANGFGQTSGKRYFEVTWTAGAGGNFGVGIGTTASTYTNMGNSATTGAIVYRANGNIWANGGTVVPVNSIIAIGATMGVAVDLDNRRIWFRTSPAGIWNNSASFNPATNFGGVTVPAGTMVPFVTFGGTSGVVNSAVTANFGDSAFSGAVPSGFLSGFPGSIVAASAQARAAILA